MDGKYFREERITMSPDMKNVHTIDEYIKTYPKETQVVLEQLRQTIQKAAPEAKESIAYGIPTFKLHGNLVHFGGYKNHIGFYPAPSGIEEFKKELSVYQTGKGTLAFPIDKPLPLDLVTRVVKFRVSQNQLKKK